MSQSVDDSIVAVSSPPGGALRSVVRVAGREAEMLVAALLDANGRSVVARMDRGDVGTIALHLPGGSAVFASIAVFRSPRSYTGEDMIEFHMSGSPHLARMIVDAVVAAGARRAAPGEFTRRAFLNGRMDLVKAEAVLASIHAANSAESAAAAEVLAGDFSLFVSRVESTILDLIAEIEARIDFVDQDIPRIESDALLARIDALQNDLRSFQADSDSRASRDASPRLLLFGPVNSGKSTLFNRLVGAKRAITSAAAGTTRDLLESPAEIAGLPVTLIDSAGQWEFPSGVDERAAAMARRAAGRADLILLVIEVNDNECRRLREFIPERRLIVVRNKIDLQTEKTVGGDDVSVSAHTGEGMDLLIGRIRERVLSMVSAPSQARAAMRQRWEDAMRAARHGAADAARIIAEGGDLVLAAMEMTSAAGAIGELTGKGLREETLDRIFRRFCIGK